MIDQYAGDYTPLPIPETSAGNLNFSIRLNTNNSNNNNNKLCLLIHKLLLHSGIPYKAFKMAIVVNFQANKQYEQQKYNQKIKSCLSRVSKQDNLHCTKRMLIK